MRVRPGHATPEIDPSFLIPHGLSLEYAPEGYEIFMNKRDECVKVVLKR
jgi:threonine dehydrogenase-like Zn-dependent dehydrogenase